MEEPHWFGSAGEYRAIGLLVRAGRYREAVDEAERLLATAGLSRTQATRLHIQVCWLYTEKLAPGPEAVLHGEQAVHLAEVMHEAYLRAEALHRLVDACCRLGDVSRARTSFDALAEMVVASDAAIPGGEAALRCLEAAVAAAAGDDEARLAALEQAEVVAGGYPAPVGARVRLQRALALLEHERYAEARPLLQAGPAPVGVDPAEWALARAWLAVVDDPAGSARGEVADALSRARSQGHLAAEALSLALQARLAGVADEAERLARRALERAIMAGRRDVARYLRRSLARVLRDGGV